MTTQSESRFQIAVLPAAAAAVEEPPPLHRIEWLICRRSSEQCLDFLRGAETVASLDFARARFDLPDLLAIFVVGDASACETLREHWASCFPHVELDFKCIPKFNANSLMKAALATLADHLARQRTLSGRAALDLAVYRGEFDRLQRSFASLEQYVGEQSLRKPRVLFEYPPGPAVFAHGTTDRSEAEASGGNPIRVQQHLPVDSLGVCGIAIDLRARGESDVPVGVELRAMETDQPLGVWSIPANRLTTGWLHLTLRHAIDQPGLSLVASIDLPGRRGTFTLGLGPPHPYERFRARIVDGAPLQAPLAMRIYGGLPGVRMPTPTIAIVPVGARPPTVTIVTPDLYKSVRQVFPAPQPQETNLVLYDPELASITVHPRAHGAMTVARIDLAVPAGAWRISAQIALEHESANPTEFALMVTAVAEAGSGAPGFEKLDEGSAGFSGWVRLSALERRRLSAFFPKGQDSRLSVYLLTRQAPNSSADFAWARFAEFEFNAAPDTLLPHERPAAVNGVDEEEVPAPNGRIDEVHTVRIPSHVEPA